MSTSENSYIQVVPDHCDRIVWRNTYYHLPLRELEPKLIHMEGSGSPLMKAKLKLAGWIDNHGIVYKVNQWSPADPTLLDDHETDWQPLFTMDSVELQRNTGWYVSSAGVVHSADGKCRITCETEQSDIAIVKTLGEDVAFALNTMKAAVQEIKRLQLENAKQSEKLDKIANVMGNRDM